MHRSGHRHRLGRRGNRRRRRDGHHRVRHARRRDRHEHRRGCLRRRGVPNEQASHRDSGEEACCRGWDAGRPVRGWGERRLGPHRDPDAVRHRGVGHRHRVRAGSPGARREQPSNRDCYRPSECEGRAWGRDVRPEPGASAHSGSQQPEPAGPPVPAPWGSGPTESVLPGSRRPESELPGSAAEPTVRPEPESEARPEPVSERRAWRRLPALPRWTRQALPTAVRRRALPMMVSRPQCRRMGLRRLQREHPSLGRTGEVDGPRGPLRSTTRI